MVAGGHGRPREARGASSRAQILAWRRESGPLTTPPGILKLRLFGEIWKMAGSKMIQNENDEESIFVIYDFI